MPYELGAKPSGNIADVVLSLFEGDDASPPQMRHYGLETIGGHRASSAGNGQANGAPPMIGNRARSGNATHAPPPMMLPSSHPAPAAAQNVIGVGPMGQVRELREAGRDHRREELDGVKYLHDRAQRLAEYRITLGARSLRRGMTFDTAEIKQRFMHKPSKRGNQLGMAKLGERPDGSDHTWRWSDGSDVPYPEEWYHEALIWVCAPDPLTDRPVVYSHVGKGGRFHHSSLAAGGAVIGAGEWIVRDGKLRKISANSGHYRPDLNTFYHAVLHLAPAFQPDTVVFMYDARDHQWVERPVREFIANPGAGRYKTHPQS